LNPGLVGIIGSIAVKRPAHYALVLNFGKERESEEKNRTEEERLYEGSHEVY